ncbi:MAG: acyl-CoA thioesterase [Magnetovibrio sp.]|nr:acyl-CoA thioesterase [Magnetovibrio sp.]
MPSETPSETAGTAAGDDEPRGELALRTLAMPADTNPAGDVFGGWLMGQMDIAGGIAAAAHAKGRVATVAVDGFTFHKPVHVGDVVCCYAEILRIGTTSITMRIQAWVLRRRIPGERVKVTEGVFTFVALDAEGRKRKIADA